MPSQDVSQDVNRKVLIVTVSLSIVFVILRSMARWVKIRRFPNEPEDLAMYVALSAFVTQFALYLAAIPTLYNALAIAAGRMAPYASLPVDLVAMLKEFLAVSIFFWLTLWAVKCSLLLMFKRLTVGLPMYERAWWCVMVIVILTFIGAVVSNFTSCSSLHAWFTAGECFTPRDARAKAISLWYALGVDLLTDLLIMAIPIRLLWNLHISLQEKIAVGLVFAVGLITMAFAIVRSVSLDGTVTSGQVSTQWLIFWGAIEGMIAILVGCLPAFAILIRGRVKASRAEYGSYPTAQSSRKGVSRPSIDERQRVRMRSESLQLRELNTNGNNSSGAQSNLNLVAVPNDGTIRVERGWTQRWQYGGDEERMMGGDRHRVQGPGP